MSGDKIQVALLGSNPGLLKKVSDKINADRPVQLVWFADLRSFLQFVIKNRPQLLGISASFPHKSTAKFPKLLKAVLGSPVLFFGEDQDMRTRKNLSSVEADYKITGTINAHNLWMKIQNFKKMFDKQSSSDVEAATKSEERQYMEDIPQPQKENDETLSQIMSALGNNKDDKGAGWNLIHFDGDKKAKKGSSSLDYGRKKTNKKEGGVHAPDFAKQKKKGTEYGYDNDSGPKSGGAFDSDPNSQEAPKQGGVYDGASSAKDPKQGGVFENADPSNDSAIPELAALAEMAKKGPSEDSLAEIAEKLGYSLLNNEDSEEDGKKNKRVDSEAVDSEAKKKPEAFDQEDSETNQQEESDEASPERDILIASCGTGFERSFNAKPIQDQETFDTQKLTVYIIEAENFRGYLVVANSEDFRDKTAFNDFRSSVMSTLQSRGLKFEFSKAYSIDLNLEDYPELVKEFTKHFINYKTSDGKLLNACLVEREAPRPLVGESDRPNMKDLDIKTIPPMTPVNFDAFIYLPRNKRYLKYLKKGGSLSLKQVKRHSAEAESTNFYLPKEQIDLFVAFFIKNTLAWEFALQNERKKAS